ncbi:DUF6003 family protein [Streptomyces sp. M41(2017)]|uniref:DUF6003 family protein n=1 Tax=unclassified Streptomyces TaxID=2593676 RepID=UPI0009BD3652|nr:DUF6003 family protein [Streptomyces sp. M41(2017)]OQQ19865.1 hypothetical protein B0675_24455 [Streptomyces sp. M41(2017)]
MTADAYLVLLNGTASTLGVSPAAVGDLACMETPAVQGWLHAQGASVPSSRLRLLPPEETSGIPEEAERLPVPLSDEELSRVRHHATSQGVGRMEEELQAYGFQMGGRESLIIRAFAAGVPAHRIAELTGEDLAAVKEIALR